MFKFEIEGGSELSGNIFVSGSKNAALTMLPAAILTDKKIKYYNLPNVQDITSMLAMFCDIGADVSIGNDGKSFVDIKFEKNIKTIGSYDYVSKMRASILIFGPMLARFGKAEVSLPGGCAIGVRPVDLHITALETLGAKIEIKNGYLVGSVPNGKLKGGTINFQKITVGGTENALMAACLATGTTIINNAAIEPEIVALGNMLNSMGAKISGLGTSVIKIEGVECLNGCEITVPSDRIQTYTYAIISAATGFGLKILNASIDDFIGTTKILEEVGIKIEEKNGKIETIKTKDQLCPISVITAPVPGFPTDCQAQLMALLTKVKGISVISEDIFENRMMHVPELNRMGANIKLHGNTATIHGVEKLSGAEVMATDLRASASLVIAGLMAKGKTTIKRIYHIERGYDFISAKLEACGAKIKKLKE